MSQRKKFHDISAIDARLTELEQEKQDLIALRKKLQASKPAPPVSGSFSPEQKIAIFRSLFRGRTDIFANRWQIDKEEAGIPSPVTMNGYRGSAISQRSNARTAITVSSVN